MENILRKLSCISFLFKPPWLKIKTKSKIKVKLKKNKK